MKEKVCPRCGAIMKVDTSAICTSIPPKYRCVCPSCHYLDFINTSDYDQPHGRGITVEEFKKMMSGKMHEQLSPIVSQISRLVSDAYEKGLFTGIEIGQKIGDVQREEQK